MEIYTIGYRKKSAEEFFEAIKRTGAETLVDVRLKNTSHLAGFAKKADLKYFLRQICDVSYRHETTLAPTEEILDDYDEDRITWDEYERRFLPLLEERAVEDTLERDLFDGGVILLCSEPEAAMCHRRLVAQYLTEQWGGGRIIHL